MLIKMEDSLNFFPKIKESSILIILIISSKNLLFSRKGSQMIMSSSAIFFICFFTMVVIHTYAHESLIFLRTIVIKLKNHNCFSNQLGVSVMLCSYMVFDIHVM